MKAEDQGGMLPGVAGICMWMLVGSDGGGIRGVAGCLCRAFAVRGSAGLHDDCGGGVRAAADAAVGLGDGALRARCCCRLAMGIWRGR